jgi:hypothetical protein
MDHPWGMHKKAGHCAKKREIYEVQTGVKNNSFSRMISTQKGTQNRIHLFLSGEHHASGARV